MLTGELFQGKVDAELILKPLLKGYLMSSDIKSTIHILEDITAKALDKDKDWTGRFLCVCMRQKKIKDDLTEILHLIKVIINKFTVIFVLINFIILGEELLPSLYNFFYEVFSVDVSFAHAFEINLVIKLKLNNFFK